MGSRKMTPLLDSEILQQAMAENTFAVYVGEASVRIYMILGPSGSGSMPAMAKVKLVYDTGEKDPTLVEKHLSEDGYEAPVRTMSGYHFATFCKTLDQAIGEVNEFLAGNAWRYELLERKREEAARAELELRAVRDAIKTAPLTHRFGGVKAFIRWTEEDLKRSA